MFIQRPQHRYGSGVFAHPKAVFKVYYPLYSVLVLSFQKQSLSSHEPSLHGTEVGMWSLVSQKEKPNERVLHKPPALKFCLEIIKTTDRQIEATTGSQLLRSSTSFEIIQIRYIPTPTTFPHPVQAVFGAEQQHFQQGEMDL